MKETPRHQRAFEVFYALGPSRTLAALAKKERISIQTAKLWSSRLGWSARIAERDAALATAVGKRTEQVELDRRVRNQKIVDGLLARTTRDVVESGPRASVSDVARLVQLDEALNAQVESPADRLDRELRSLGTDELRALARTELRELALQLGEDAVVALLDAKGGALDRDGPE